MVPFLLVIGQFLRINTNAIRDPNVRPLAMWSALLLVVGTVFYHNIEGWSWLDSLYFCVISLATVGYGDLHPTTELSKVFTIVYVMSGIGILLAFVDAMFERGREDRARRARARHDSRIRDKGKARSGSHGERT
jgi:voltage-gated potassium channel